jgi:L-2,4-diaminobutyrate transaminase
VLDIVEREDIPGQAKTTGAHFQKSLRKAFSDFPIVAEVRGVGMMAAVEFVADPATKTRFDPELKVGARIAQAARDRGLIVRAMPHGDILGFSPPLVMSAKEVDEMVAIAADATRHVLKQL